MIEITNHGPLILASNYWESPLAKAGVLFFSSNAGAFRLLIPEQLEPSLAEMRTAKTIVVSTGPGLGRLLAWEVLFDDDSSDPYAIHFGEEQTDKRLPVESDVGREWVLTVWTQPRRGKPHRALERPAWYRRVAEIPWLKALEKPK